jgi:hypothetical protein
MCAGFIEEEWANLVETNHKMWIFQHINEKKVSLERFLLIFRNLRKKLFLADPRLFFSARKNSVLRRKNHEEIADLPS